MMFSINNTYDLDKETLNAYIRLRARKIILTYPIKSAEKVLDIFLVKEYKMPLKTICLQLLDELQTQYNYSNQIIFMFKDKKLDKLASLITYGNSELQGSKILRCALSN